MWAARFLLPCLLALMFCLLPNAASAEGRCPPGMFETGSRDFIACAPIPGYGETGQDGGDEPSRPRAPPVEIQPSYMAAAQHVDTGSLWVSVGHRTLDAAKQHVLKACNAATRGGCYVSDTHFGVGELYVAEDAMGQLWTKMQPYDKDSPRFSVVDWNAAIEHCWKNSFGCRYAGASKVVCCRSTIIQTRNITKTVSPRAKCDGSAGHWSLGRRRPLPPLGKTRAG